MIPKQKNFFNPAHHSDRESITHLAHLLEALFENQPAALECYFVDTLVDDPDQWEKLRKALRDRYAGSLNIVLHPDIFQDCWTQVEVEADVIRRGWTWDRPPVHQQKKWRTHAYHVQRAGLDDPLAFDVRIAWSKVV